MRVVRTSSHKKLLCILTFQLLKQSLRLNPYCKKTNLRNSSYLKLENWIFFASIFLIILASNFSPTAIASEGPYPGTPGADCSTYSAAPENANLLPDGSNLRVVTADVSVTGLVYGTDTYWSASKIAKTVVHAGVLADGQSAVIDIIKAAPSPPYIASTQNGVSSNGITTNNRSSFTLAFVHACTGDAPETPENLTSTSSQSHDGNFSLSWNQSSSGPLPDGYLVLENGNSLSFPETRNYEDTALIVSGKPNGIYEYEVYACNEGTAYNCSAAAQFTVVVDNTTGPLPSTLSTLCTANHIPFLTNAAAYSGSSTRYLTGDKNASGSIFGTDVYDGGSTIQKAAIHAGIVADGESAIVTLNVSNPQAPYTGSTRNGITSNSLSSPLGSNSYTFTFVEDCILDPPEAPQNLSSSESQSSDGSYSLTWESSLSGPQPEGFIVTENGASLSFSGPNATRNYEDESLVIIDKPDGTYLCQVYACHDGQKYHCSDASEISVTVANGPNDADGDGIPDDQDPFPNPISYGFSDSSQLPLSTLVTSDAIIVDGFVGEMMTGITPISGVSGLVQVSVNGEPYRSVELRDMSTLAGAPVVPGDTIQLRMTTSPNLATTSAARLTIGPDIGGGGGIELDWSVTTTSIDPNGPGDMDGDGVADNFDIFPFDGNEWEDSDGDNVGNNADAFPLNMHEWLDTDGDGVGDNTDAFPNNAFENSDIDNNGQGDIGQGMDLVTEFSGIDYIDISALEIVNSAIACKAMSFDAYEGIVYTFDNIPMTVTEVEFSVAFVNDPQNYTPIGQPITDFDIDQPTQTKEVTVSAREIFPDFEAVPLDEYIIKASYLDNSGEEIGSFRLQSNVRPQITLDAEFTGSSTKSLKFTSTDSISIVTQVGGVPSVNTIEKIKLFAIGNNGESATHIFDNEGEGHYPFQVSASEVNPGVYSLYTEVTIDGDTYNSNIIRIHVTEQGTSTPPPTISLASTLSLQTDAAYTLSWSTTNSNYCTAGGTGGIINNEFYIAPICGATSFDLEVTCFGDGGSVADTIAVSVTGASSCPTNVEPNDPGVIQDNDNDGLSDADEDALGTDPLDSDTDGDSLLDGFEVAYGLDPLLVTSATDTDSDGSIDVIDLDDDNDGMADSC
ncbi:MAG: hypothetical protein GKR91_10150 [Pseudomonadales bacterium]|nr:hypothetical protein [Pseudomonadales bacterium]